MTLIMITNVVLFISVIRLGDKLDKAQAANVHLRMLQDRMYSGLDL